MEIIAPPQKTTDALLISINLGSNIAEKKIPILFILFNIFFP